MIEPLPKARSIWLSAASSAFDLSILDDLCLWPAAVYNRCAQGRRMPRPPD